MERPSHLDLFSVLLPESIFVSALLPINDLDEVHRIGQSVMLDNGAFTQWKRNPGGPVYAWDGYYDWVRPWLDCRTTWCVIPDVINGSESENDRLICEWFSKIGLGGYRQAAPVWHLHESFQRLERLVQNFERVCFGSSGEYRLIGSDKWNNRMNDVFNFICKGSGIPHCWIHMLRGMSLSNSIYPFASVDSTDIARNHNRPQNNARDMADYWDGQQPAMRWVKRPVSVQIQFEEKERK